MLQQFFLQPAFVSHSLSQVITIRVNQLPKIETFDLGGCIGRSIWVLSLRKAAAESGMVENRLRMFFD